MIPVRYLLDTNVLSELIRPVPEPRVVAWVAAQRGLSLGISVLSLGEIARGVKAMPEGRRRDNLQLWLERDLPAQFSGRVLPIETPIACEWGRLAADARKHGRGLSVVDGLLLATAAVHGLVLVTRNVADCTGHGIDVINPWE